MSDQVTAPAATPDTSAPVDAEVNEGQEPVEEGTEPAAKSEPKKKAPSFRKYKIGNEEVALTDDDIARDYSKWKGGDKALREAAEAKKSVQEFMERFIADPESVLGDKRLSVDKKKLAEKWLVEQLESELNPPDPRDQKLTAAERELKAYKDKEAAAAAEAEQTEQSKAIETRRTELGNVLRKAGELTPLSGTTPESQAAVIREMAMYMRAARERGESPTAEEVAEHIHNTRFQQFYSLAHQFDGPELIDFLGEEIVTRIRKADLARLRGAREPEAQHRSEPGQRRESTKVPKRMDAHAAKAAMTQWAKK